MMSSENQQVTISYIGVSKTQSCTKKNHSYLHKLLKQNL
jgi:hypothetical protein